MKGTYTQLTVKFPASKERYRMAVECINDRDRSIFHTQADYLTAAVLSFEDRLSDEETSLRMIYEKLQLLEQKVDRLSHA